MKLNGTNQERGNKARVHFSRVGFLHKINPQIPFHSSRDREGKREVSRGQDTD